MRLLLATGTLLIGAALAGGAYWTFLTTPESTVFTLAASAQQDPTIKAIQEYRDGLQGGNPAELWEFKGEDLWKEARGPKKTSLEKCDLGMGPGVVKGAYARLPRYFKDADAVQDLESRIVYCMTTLQGIKREDATRRVFGGPGARCGAIGSTEMRLASASVL